MSEELGHVIEVEDLDCVSAVLKYADAFDVLRKEQPLFRWMVAGSILGAGLGGLALGMIPTNVLMTLLGAILLISAVKTFRHAH